jgi:hypothetical protein
MEFARQLWGEHAYDHLYFSVFYKLGGKPYEDAQSGLTPLLKECFKQYLEVDGIGVQQYHTLAAAVSCHLGVAHLMDHTDEVTEGLQSQMGHTQAIADLFYGLESGDRAADNARTRAIHKNASRLWHENFLGLPKTTPNSKEEHKKPIDEQLTQMDARIAGIESRMVNIERILEKILESVQPPK